MPVMVEVFWETARAVCVWISDHIFFVNLILSVGIVFFQRRDPKTVWAWLLALNFIPVFGIIFYLLFCQDFKKSRMFRIKEVEDRLNLPAKIQEGYIKSRNLALLGELAGDYESLVLYNLDTSGSVLTTNNQIRIFTDGEEKFADLRKELEAARQYIHIQYYIIKNDEVLDAFKTVGQSQTGRGPGGHFLSAGARTAEPARQLQKPQKDRCHRRAVWLCGGL